MKGILGVHLFLFFLLVEAFPQTPTLPADYDQKISDLQKQLGQAVDVLTLGLEIYQVVNSPDIESALENFVAKTGIQLYPSLLLKTKNETANKFFAEFAQLRQSSYQEPYLILELTFSDSSAAFKVSPSPGLEKHRKKIQELCNVHIGGFLSGKNKLSLLGNVPKLALSLRNLADGLAESGIVDKVGQAAQALKEFLKGALTWRLDSSTKEKMVRTKKWQQQDSLARQSILAFNGEDVALENTDSETEELDIITEYEETTQGTMPENVIDLAKKSSAAYTTYLQIGRLTSITEFLSKSLSNTETFTQLLAEFGNTNKNELLKFTLDALTAKDEKALQQLAFTFVDTKIKTLFP